jgi:hypothetical protein
MDERVNDYKLHIKSTPQFKSSRNFINFYSNGPPYIEDTPFYLRK